MKFIKILNLILITVLTIIINNAFSQTPDEINCATSNCNPSYPYGIPNLTTGTSEALKIAIIYVTFKDDVQDGFSAYTIWPKPLLGNASRPNVSLINASKQPSFINFMSRYSSYTLSDFFCQMSMGQFDVIGDEFAVILPENSTYYRDNHTYYGQLNEIVLQQAKIQTNINYASYNNWSLNNGGLGIR